MNETEVPLPEKPELLVEHYQKTYELTNQFWSQRNQIFLILVSAVGIAAILTYSPADTNPLLVAWLAKLLDIKEESQVMALHRSFPFALLQGIMLIVIFYLMVNLFHRSLYVLRNYAYLGKLEHEIRASLKFSKQSVGFTRESYYYWNKRPFLLSTVKWAYIVLLGGLLGIFLWGRLAADCAAKNIQLLVVDIVAALPIVAYFCGYTWYTLRWDTDKISLAKKPKVNAV